MQYAIDFGTSNTVVARRTPNGQIETVKLPFSIAITSNIGSAANQQSLISGLTAGLIPSLVYVVDASQDQVIIGQTVRDRGLDWQQNIRFFSGFKRALCQPAPGFLPQLDGTQISWQAIASYFLEQIVEQLPELDSLVFTVPIDSFEPYRQWLRTFCLSEAGQNISQIRILDEPTAAALGYGLGYGLDNDLTAIKDQALQNLLVIDFGGGTLDLVWVQLKAESLTKSSNRNWLKWGKRLASNTIKQHPTAKVIAKYGINLGGIDIDQWILEFWIEQKGIAKNSLTNRLAEKLKIALSHQSEATEVFFDDLSFNAIELNLNLQQLAQILEQHHFFANLDRSLYQIKTQIEAVGLSFEQVDGVILVGGTCQLSAFQTWITKHFRPELIHHHLPFEAIAHGALAQIWQLEDILYHSYAVRYWDKKYQRHSWHPLIKAGTQYPLPTPVELILGAAIANQSSIELVIGEISEAAVEIIFEDNFLITRNLQQNSIVVQPLNDSDSARVIAQLDPPGNPGSDRIKIDFIIDSNRNLCITVFDLLSQKILIENQPVIELI
jgi:molecular chaperone DnaK (HSP70)